MLPVQTDLNLPEMVKRQMWLPSLLRMTLRIALKVVVAKYYRTYLLMIIITMLL